MDFFSRLFEALFVLHPLHAMMVHFPIALTSVALLFVLLARWRRSEGLDLAAEKTPNLILLDINLPEMDGYEVLKRLRAQAGTSQIPVIAISANAMPRDVAKGKEAGFDAYLTKPLQVDKFFEAVDKALH